MAGLARGGAIIVAPVALATGGLGALWYFSGAIAAVILFLVASALLVLTANFFRDPDRVVGEGIVAPADGVVSIIESRGPAVLIATFMNIHDVHVNRAPEDCRVRRIERIGGPRRPAYAHDADKNNRIEYELETPHGTIHLVQIAGIVARRILPYVAEGADLAKGDRLGLIRFGSRVDILIPAEGPAGRLEPRVKKGDRVKAGASTLAVYR